MQLDALPKVAILIPTYGRAKSLEPLLMNLRQTTPPVYRVLFVVDAEDEPTWDEMERLDYPEIMALEHTGTYPEKVNAGVGATSEPWVLLTADDVRFYPDWYDSAMAQSSEGVGVIGTNDLHNPAVQRGEYATQILVARWYALLGTIDGPGVFHEGYHHNCIDVEMCETAQARGMYAHAHESRIEHLHFIWGKAEIDPTYERGCLTDTAADETLLRQRRRLWEQVAV